MRRWIRDHGLALVAAVLFLLFAVGTLLAGWRVDIADRADHGLRSIPLGAYLVSGAFGEALFENWESEFLQMGMYVVLTAILWTAGSSQSREPGSPPEERIPARPDSPWPVRRGGWVLRLYENSLLILFGLLFIASFALHAIAGAAAYSEEQLQHGQPAVTALQYLATAQYWFESLQNWQSEFLVMALLVVATICLRQRGSTESKPVEAPHTQTGSG